MSDANELVFEETREKLLEGINLLADVTAPTLGPKGLNIGLDASWGAPKITNDGNSVAFDIEMNDQFANMGVSLGKEVCEKIKDHSGDGTTTGIVLLRELVAQGVKHIASGASPILVKRGMEESVEAMIKAIEESASHIENDEDIRKIATVSASGREDVGEKIFEAIGQVGKTGVVTIEEGKSTETTVEVVKGMRFDRGYMSGYFMTDSEKQIAEFDSAKILITDKKISSIQEILPLLQSMLGSGTPLMIIADDIEGDALSTLVVNKLRGTLNVIAVKAPGFGDRKKAMLEDIAVMTGGTLITEDAGIALKDATVEMLGSCEKVEVTKDHSTLVGGSGDEAAIASRVAQLQAETEAASSSYDKEKLQERVAKFTNGVAIIKVGAHTEPEMKQLKQMYEDSLNSTKAAIDSGVVIGGGVALLQATRKLKLELKGDAKYGMEMVLKGAEAPFRQIVGNSGHEPSVYLEEVLNTGENLGFDANTDAIVNLIDAGIVDPAKVVTNALRFAASTAGIVLLSEVLIGESEEEDA